MCVNNTSICKMVTHMQSEIYSAMYRMICKYGWGWGMTCNIINRQYGTNYIEFFTMIALLSKSKCIIRYSERQ